MFLSPGQSGNVARHGQSYYTSGSVRGTARGGRGLAQNFRSPGWHRGIYLRYSLTAFFFFFVFCFPGLVCMYGLGMLLQHFSCIDFFILVQHQFMLLRRSFHFPDPFQGVGSCLLSHKGKVIFF